MQRHIYWSATENKTKAWIVNLSNHGVYLYDKAYECYVMVDPIVNTTKTESLFEPYAAYAIEGVHPFNVSCGLKSLYFLI